MCTDDPIHRTNKKLIDSLLSLSHAPHHCERIWTLLFKRGLYAQIDGFLFAIGDPI
jgi:hypothetical protein